ncbi:MAG: ornithine carbamoyltransferase [Candidatus Cryosericum sp.]|nr:ornithine carbamoyltransferase [Candidatus Cryosericum sp.]HPS69453.1 ornithine carbamoyltransferase [Candidatus Cryosericum sp.]
MNTKLKGRDFLSTNDWTDEELDTLLEVAFDLKKQKALGIPHRLLEDKTLFMLFRDKSTRTRNSTEAAMTQLGGHAHYLTEEAVQISHGDTEKELGIILSRYGHGIAIRDDIYLGAGHKYMTNVATWADIPVISLESDFDHPCQMMADIMTIQEKFHHEVRGRKFVMSWAYAPSYAKPLACAQGSIMMMPRFGMDVTLAMPPEFQLQPEALAIARQNAEAAGVRFEVTNNMDEALEGADIVEAKSWGCFMTTRDLAEAQEIAKKYTGWILDERRMGLASKSAIYMHPLPADRGCEVTNEVIDGPHSVVYDEAENRLHTVKAILALTM